jgi:hypothetical protein
VGFEVVAMIRKAQLQHIGANDIQAQSGLVAGLFQIAAGCDASPVSADHLRSTHIVATEPLILVD